MQVLPSFNAISKKQIIPTNFCGDIENNPKSQVNNINLDKTPDADLVELKKNDKRMSELEKKQIIYKAQTNAAGWSILGMGLSSLYFGLRSDNTIAEKYNLEPKKDVVLINEIRKQQVIATVPSIAGLGVLGWLGFKVFAKPQPEEE